MSINGMLTNLYIQHNYLTYVDGTTFQTLQALQTLYALAYPAFAWSAVSSDPLIAGTFRRT